MTLKKNKRRPIRTPSGAAAKAENGAISDVGTRSALSPSKERLLDAAETLVAYLNLTRHDLRRRGAVEQIELLLVRLTELGREFTELLNDAGLSRKERNRREAELEGGRRRFNEWFDSLPQSPPLHLEGWDEHSRPIFFPESLDSATALSLDISDQYLASCLRQLAREDGWIDRLRPCARCGVWFFARKPWAKFHPGGNCKKVAARSTDKFKKENKKYQRKYFREKLSTYQDLYLKGYSPAEVREVVRDRKRKRRRFPT